MSTFAWLLTNLYRAGPAASRAGASVSILDLPDALALVNERLLPALLPALGDAFPSGMLGADIRLQEARLVKYFVPGHGRVFIHPSSALFSAMPPIQCIRPDQMELVKPLSTDVYWGQN